MKKEKVYAEEYVHAAGIEHYLLHYRSRPEDPVLLFIHGGPGQTESFFAYVVEEYAARDYNIVYYDQRGAGKTWLKNRRSRPDTETLKNDLLEIVLYLKRIYGKEKIGILGHSWGSVLGSMFVMEHPEHTLCYIGCGQVINILENERTGYAILKSVIEKGGSGKDSQTPIEISMKYFEQVQAPDKKLYLIVGAGHAPMIDNVDDYRRALREIVHRVRES